MTLAEWMLASLALVTALCAVACRLCWRTAYRDGYTDGQADERAYAISRRQAAAAPPPAELLYDSAEPAPDDVDAWLASLSQERQPAGRHHAPDNWTTTALTALPGDWRPARPPADTGSFRAELVQRTDAFIAQITAGA